MSKEIDELIRDLSGIGFIKSSVRKRVEQFVSEYKKRIIQIGEGMKELLDEICKAEKHHPYEGTSCTFVAKKETLSDYQKKIESL